MCKPKQSQGNKQSCTLSFRLSHSMHDWLQSRKEIISLTEQINDALRYYRDNVGVYISAPIPSDELAISHLDQKILKLKLAQHNLEVTIKQVQNLRNKNA